MVTVHVRLATPAPTLVHFEYCVSGEPATASASQSCEPPRPLASVVVTESPVMAVAVLTVNVGGGSMVTVRDADVPPPGAGFVTATCAWPVAASIAAVAVKRISVELNVVDD